MVPISGWSVRNFKRKCIGVVKYIIVDSISVGSCIVQESEIVICIRRILDNDIDLVPFLQNKSTRRRKTLSAIELDVTIDDRSL